MTQNKLLQAKTLQILVPQTDGTMKIQRFRVCPGCSELRSVEYGHDIDACRRRRVGL